MQDLNTITEIPESYFVAAVKPVVYVNESHAMFALLVTPVDGGDEGDEDGLPLPIAMSYVDAVKLGEAILETVDAATANYFAPVNLRKSSNIEAAHYHRGKATLRVSFQGGTVYDYYGVPSSVIVAWSDAESVGRFFNDTFTNKKKGGPDKYPFVKREQE